ncbi:Hypothetical protein LBF_1197 [Leptospira biflexa serovar Patoc strain 'Patoc 1 (Ames)']|nr:Hypothetical protein LBF_1197 [Leptospira biflexa serovar Patoc strain 'Patoc 1 (Ames)']
MGTRQISLTEPTEGVSLPMFIPQLLNNNCSPKPERTVFPRFQNRMSGKFEFYFFLQTIPNDNFFPILYVRWKKPNLCYLRFLLPNHRIPIRKFKAGEV